MKKPKKSQIDATYKKLNEKTHNITDKEMAIIFYDIFGAWPDVIKQNTRGNPDK